jgi:hypothetical protein
MNLRQLGILLKGVVRLGGHVKEAPVHLLLRHWHRSLLPHTCERVRVRVRARAVPWPGQLGYRT